MNDKTCNGEGKERIPKTWEWYGEAIKWFIAIATALLAFGFDQAADGKLLAWKWCVYLLGAGLLGISVVAGLFAYLQLLGAATLKEKETPTEAEKTQTKKHHQRLSSAYKFCVGALGFGLVLSSIAFIGSVLPEDKLTPVIPLSVIKSGSDDIPFVVRHSAKGTEIMTITASGKLQWTTVAVPTTTAESAPATK